MEPKSEVTLNDVLAYFASTSGGKLQSDTYSIADDKLYDGGDLIAIKMSGNRFILSNNLKQDISDSLIFCVARVNGTFSRTNISSLYSPATYTAAIEKQDNDTLALARSIFGFEYTDEDTSAVQRAKDFTERAKTFFDDITKKQAEEKRVRELAAMEATERKRYEAWDKGEGTSSNHLVLGAGRSGLRLRTKPGGSNRVYVESSGGQRTTIGVVKRAWNYACGHWYQGKGFGYRGSTESSYSLGNSYNSRTCRVGADYVNIGCQRVSKDEAERFAELQGWNREGTN